MSLEIEGKVIEVLEEQRGGTAERQWVKQMFVIEVESRFPRKVCFAAWGDMIDKVKELVAGDNVKVSFDLESREYNGRWYTDAKAWRIQRTVGEEGEAPIPPLSADVPDFPGEDDLPF